MPGQAKSIKHLPRKRDERAPAELEVAVANGKVDYSATYQYKGINIGVTERQGHRRSQEDRVAVDEIQGWGLLTAAEQEYAFKQTCEVLQQQVRLQQKKAQQQWKQSKSRRNYTEAGATAVIAVVGKQGMLVGNLGDAEGLRYTANDAPLQTLTPELHDCHSPTERERVNSLISNEPEETKSKKYPVRNEYGQIIDYRRRGFQPAFNGIRLFTGDPMAMGGIEPLGAFGDTGFGNLLRREPTVNFVNHAIAECRSFDIYACDGLREGFAEPILLKMYRQRNRLRNRHTPIEKQLHPFKESILDNSVDSAALTAAVNAAIREFINLELTKAPNITLQALSEALANEAIKRGSSDNVSVTVVEVSPRDLDESAGCVVATYDGHTGEDVAEILAQYLGATLQQQVTALKKQKLAFTSRQGVINYYKTRWQPSQPNGDTIQRRFRRIMRETNAILEDIKHPLLQGLMQFDDKVFHQREVFIALAQRHFAKQADVLLAIYDFEALGYLLGQEKQNKPVITALTEFKAKLYSVNWLQANNLTELKDYLDRIGKYVRSNLSDDSEPAADYKLLSGELAKGAKDSTANHYAVLIVAVGQARGCDEATIAEALGKLACHIPFAAALVRKAGALRRIDGLANDSSYQQQLAALATQLRESDDKAAEEQLLDFVELLFEAGPSEEHVKASLAHALVKLSERIDAINTNNFAGQELKKHLLAVRVEVVCQATQNDADYAALEKQVEAFNGVAEKANELHCAESQPTYTDRREQFIQKALDLRNAVPTHRHDPLNINAINVFQAAAAHIDLVFTMEYLRDKAKLSNHSFMLHDDDAIKYETELLVKRYREVANANGLTRQQKKLAETLSPSDDQPINKEELKQQLQIVRMYRYVATRSNADKDDNHKTQDQSHFLEFMAEIPPTPTVSTPTNQDLYQTLVKRLEKVVVNIGNIYENDAIFQQVAEVQFKHLQTKERAKTVALFLALYQLDQAKDALGESALVDESHSGGESSDGESFSDTSSADGDAPTDPSTDLCQQLTCYRNTILAQLDSPQSGYTVVTLTDMAKAGSEYATKLQRIYRSHDENRPEQFVEASREFRQSALVKASGKDIFKGVVASIILGGAVLVGAVMGTVFLTAALGPLGFLIGAGSTVLMTSTVSGVGFWAGSRKSASKRQMDTEVERTADAGKAFAVDIPYRTITSA